MCTNTTENLRIEDIQDVTEDDLESLITTDVIGQYSSGFEPLPDNTTGWVYILCLDKPWRVTYKTGKVVIIRHYIGFSKSPLKRLYHHRHNNGAAFTRALNERGITYTKVVQFRGTKKDERRLKNLSKTKIIHYCPRCTPGNIWKFHPKGLLLHEQEYLFTSD